MNVILSVTITHEHMKEIGTAQWIDVGSRLVDIICESIYVD